MSGGSNHRENSPDPVHPDTYNILKQMSDSIATLVGKVASLELSRETLMANAGTSRAPQHTFTPLRSVSTANGAIPDTTRQPCPINRPLTQLPKLRKQAVMHQKLQLGNILMAMILFSHLLIHLLLDMLLLLTILTGFKMTKTYSWRRKRTGVRTQGTNSDIVENPSKME